MLHEYSPGHACERLALHKRSPVILSHLVFRHGKRGYTRKQSYKLSFDSKLSLSECMIDVFWFTMYLSKCNLLKLPMSWIHLVINSQLEDSNKEIHLVSLQVPVLFICAFLFTFGL